MLDSCAEPASPQHATGSRQAAGEPIIRLSGLQPAVGLLDRACWIVQWARWDPDEEHCLVTSTVKIFSRYILREVVQHAAIGVTLFTFVIFMRDLGRLLE